MRLANLQMLNRLVGERERLIEQRALMRDGRGLAVTINGNHFDGAMLELIRPVAIGELSGRIRKIDQELVDLGLDLS